MMMGPIPWTAVRKWATEHGVADVGRFEHLIERLDSTYLSRSTKSVEESDA